MSNHDPDNIPSNLSGNEHFQSIVDQVVSRRSVLKAGLGLSSVAFLGGALTGCNGSSSSTPAPAPTPSQPVSKLGFTSIATDTGSLVKVPEGYRADVLIPWGSALFADSPAWKDYGTNTGADQARQIGDNHDGMHFFPIDGQSNTEGLLVLNHEYNNKALYADGTAPATDDEKLKSQHAHGISIVHIKKSASSGKWEVRLDSPYNRRIHALTSMALTGPARADGLLATTADPTGTTSLGTINNCGNGATLWGTYLTCEENFNGYFVNGDSTNALHKRYGIGSGWGYDWHTRDARFDAAAHPNEPNRFGWVVEIDPFEPTSTPKKRTALGRIKHENCAMTLAADKRVVVYMGDDQRGDYIYKFVSDGTYDALNPIGNRKLLESGKLYVAKFSDGEASGDFMGTGEWVLLDKNANDVLKADDATFPNQAAVLVGTRLAADAVGATPMDRPEWVTVHPATGEVYITLTNNKERGDAGKPPVDAANPRADNYWGHIIRWREAGGDAAATTFEWDVFVLAGNPVAYSDRSDLRSGSDNVTADNMFNSPDGLAFDAQGRLWIQTDGNYSNSGDFQGQGNNQMLAADPVTKEIRRFLVGPYGAEITGITWTPDMKTMFVNVQHPEGSASGDHWPKNQWPNEVTGNGGRPRSATMIISREDSGVIGA